MGSMLLLRGVAEVLTGGSDVGFQGKYPGFRKLGEGVALGLPVPFWFAIGAIAIVAFLMHRTLFGRYCYAIGSNAEAARLSGIPVAWIRLFTFIGAAVLSGVAGMLYVAYLPTATPSLGNAFELHAIAAAVLGGCSLQGGKGTVFGVLIGAGILQITFNAVNLVGQSLWQNVVAGGVILAAVIVDRLFEKNRTFAASKKTTPTSTSTNTQHERAGERGCAGGGTVMSKRILVTGAAGKVGQAVHRAAARGSGPARRGRARAVPQPQAARARSPRGLLGIDRKPRQRRRGDAGRDPRPAPGDQQGDARVDHGRRGQGPVLAAGGGPDQPDVQAVRPDRRRRRHGPLLLPAPDPGHRDAEAQRLSRAATRCRRCSRR